MTGLPARENLLQERLALPGNFAPFLRRADILRILGIEHRFTGEKGVAAHHRHFFHHEHARARLMRGNGRGKPGGPAADYGDIAREVAAIRPFGRLERTGKRRHSETARKGEKSATRHRGAWENIGGHVKG